jgi:hypothetical protein
LEVEDFEQELQLVEQHPRWEQHPGREQLTEYLDLDIELVEEGTEQAKG